jgi:hypothetical protein
VLLGDASAGAFDDLLGETKPPAVSGPLSGDSLIALAISLMEPGAAPPRRPLTCCRCETLADAARHRGDPVPPVHAVESWRGPLGYRVHGGLCRGCADIEWSRRWSVEYSVAEKAHDHTKMRELTERAMGRELRGRKVLVDSWRGRVAPPAHQERY